MGKKWPIDIPKLKLLRHQGCLKARLDLECSSLRACSHEPGTVNYLGVMIAPGQALPRVHMMTCCLGASSSSSDHYEFIRIPLVFTQIVTENEF